MKTLKKTAAWWGVGLCLTVAGCQTPGVLGPRQYSASETGAFAADSSDSGASSDGSGSNSDSGSGNSSDGSGNSSDGSGNSSDGSGNSSQDSGNSSEDSGNSSGDSGNSSDNSSGDSKSDSGNSSGDSNSRTSGENNNPVASATVLGLTAAGLGAVFWQAAQHAMREPPPASAPPPPPQEVSRAAQTYLRSRTHQLREDLALGAGPTIEELASLARIRRENLGVFGRLLRTHRQELLALADTRALTPARAVEWMRRVGELASTDPRLEEDRRAFLAAYEAGELSR